MATENDRIITNQIEMWADPPFWQELEPPKFTGVSPRSSAIARLIGAAAPIAVISLLEPEITDKLKNEVIRNYANWTASKINFSEADAESLLNKLISLTVVNIVNPAEATSELADIWISAIISSWVDEKYKPNIINMRQDQIIANLIYQNEHAIKELQ
jgi:hypothetical protein